MMTDCSRLKALLGAYADGELDAAGAEQIREHLVVCAECRRELETLRQLHLLARRAGPPELQDDYWDWHRTRVWRRLNEDTRKRQRFFRPSFAWPKLATLAGGLVVVLVVAVVGWQTLGPGLIKHAGRVPVERPLVTGTPPSVAGSVDSGQPAIAAEEVAAGGKSEPVRAKVRGRVEPGKDVRVAREEELRTESGAGVAAAEEPAATATATTAEKKDVPRDRDRASFARRRSSAPSPETAVRELTDDEFRKTPVESLAGLLKGGTVFQIVGAKSQPNRADVRPAPVGVQPVPATDDTGTAVVRLTTDTLGTVIDARIVHSSGKPKLDSIALSMARRARFSPGKRDGKPSRFEFDLPYRFNKLAQKKKTGK